MSHAASQFARTGNSGLSPVARLAILVAVLVAMIVAGAAMFGHSDSVAASRVATSMAETALRLASAANTDPSVPQASDVFSGQEPAAEEACATF